MIVHLLSYFKLFNNLSTSELEPEPPLFYGSGSSPKSGFTGGCSLPWYVRYWTGKTCPAVIPGSGSALDKKRRNSEWYRYSLSSLVPTLIIGLSKTNIGYRYLKRNKFFLVKKVGCCLKKFSCESLLAIGAGAGDKNTRSRSKTDRLHITALDVGTTAHEHYFLSLSLTINLVPVP